MTNVSCFCQSFPPAPFSCPTPLFNGLPPRFWRKYPFPGFTVFLPGHLLRIESMLLDYVVHRSLEGHVLPFERSPLRHRQGFVAKFPNSSPLRVLRLIPSRMTRGVPDDGWSPHPLPSPPEAVQMSLIKPVSLVAPTMGPSVSLPFSVFVVEILYRPLGRQILTSR